MLRGLTLVLAALAVLYNRRSGRSQHYAHTKFTTLSVPETAEMYCVGETHSARSCRARSLRVLRGRLHLPRPGVLFNVPQNTLDTDRPLLDMSGVSDHNVFYLRLSTAEVNMPDGCATLAQPARVFSRFYPLNAMHAVHDDLLPLAGLDDVWPRAQCALAVDNYGAQPYDAHVYPAAVNLNRSDGSALYYGTADAAYVVRDAVVGLDRRTTWYQYGLLGVPQGPTRPAVLDPRVRALFARFRDFLLRLPNASQCVYDVPAPGHGQLTLTDDSESHQPGSSSEDSGGSESGSNLTPLTHSGTLPRDGQVLAVFSRRRDRLILNEDELAVKLGRQLHLTPVFVRLETGNLACAVRVLSRAAAAVGMHGAALILAGAMPPGAGLLELFPLAVPPADYAPFRALAGLVGLRYAAWRNVHAERSHVRPERRAAMLAAVTDLQRAAEIQDDAVEVRPHVCCDDAHWLYRIYQDTDVDAGEVVSLMRHLGVGL